MKQRLLCLWIELLDLNEFCILLYIPFFLLDEQNGMEWVGMRKYEAVLYMDPNVLKYQGTEMTVVMLACCL